MAGSWTICSCLALMLWTSLASGQTLLGPTAGICESVVKGKCQNRATGCNTGYTRATDYYANNPWVCGFQFVCCVPQATNTVDNCGKRVPVAESRILSGLPTIQCDWPFVVSIRALTTNMGPALTLGTTQHSCAGVILNQNWIMTHPLCCYLQDGTLAQASSNLVVVANDYNVNANDIDPATRMAAEQIIKISKCYVHPQYQPNFDGSLKSSVVQVDVNSDLLANGNAVALIRLAEPIKASNCASQACLPSAAPLKSTGCDTFNNCVFLGWGYSATDYSVLDPKLRYGKTSVYRGTVCDYLAKSVFTNRPRPTGSACTQPQGGTDVCVGDQGGPVLCYDGERWAVQGILPFRWCESSSPNPWITDVSAYEGWIQTTMANP